MRKYKIIALTDHRGHSEENSIYALLRSLHKNEQCGSLHVASRGFNENDEFFNDIKSTSLFVKNVDSKFAFDPTGEFFSSDCISVDLLDYDIIFLRLPRPVSDEFFTRISQLAKDKVIINNPKGIMTTSTKAFLLNFPESCPDIKLCNSIEEVLNFSKDKDIVLKPLKEYGGKGILKITGDFIDDGQEKHHKTEYLQKIKNYIETEGYLAMKFLKNVDQGDKRILVVNGEILAASLRLPAKDSWLCNVALGGTSVTSEPTEEEIKIVENINPKLLEHGILIYGMDTLVDDDGKRVLSEINTMSIGGFPQAEEQTGRPIVKLTTNKIIAYANAKYSK